MTLAGRRCKLDPKLLSALVVTGSVHFVDWGGVCGELLDSVPKMIYGGRIEMNHRGHLNAGQVTNTRPSKVATETYRL
ncbi:hypothetical protein Golax_018195 [Gossypium laxum]|uniref:Uncharacterized protein n=1 Tax=Gossypium laxum TaxID=34288 RepID=A0A7J8Z3V8_9ROSI|nr:hypothetical protein [Gossypium laxum]